MIYEITIITTEETTAEDMAEIKQAIMDHAEIKTEADDGIKSLAYPITRRGKEHTKGHYLFYTADIEGKNYQPIASEYNGMDQVLRYLIVKQDTRRH